MANVKDLTLGELREFGKVRHDSYENRVQKMKEFKYVHSMTEEQTCEAYRIACQIEEMEHPELYP